VSLECQSPKTFLLLRQKLVPQETCQWIKDDGAASYGRLRGKHFVYVLLPALFT
jgi:hypothetical protein